MMFNLPVGKVCGQCFWYDEEARKQELEGGICYEGQPQVVAMPHHVRDPNDLRKTEVVWRPAHIENGVRATRRACSKFVALEEALARANPS